MSGRGSGRTADKAASPAARLRRTSPLPDLVLANARPEKLKHETLSRHLSWIKVRGHRAQPQLSAGSDLRTRRQRTMPKRIGEHEARGPGKPGTFLMSGVGLGVCRAMLGRSRLADPVKILVGARGFEPPTPSPPDWCANQAALRSERAPFAPPGLEGQRPIVFQCVAIRRDDRRSTGPRGRRIKECLRLCARAKPLQVCFDVGEHR